MSSLLRRTTRTGLVLSMLAFAAPAQGQTAAAALFDEAKVLMKAGAYDRACPKIQEAHRLSPTPGTVLTLGDCLEHAGKLASSWSAFKEAEVAARNAKDADREREAARRADLLTPRLAKLTIVVPPMARVPGFELKRDGEKIGEGQWGSALPVDTGEHMIEASAPGRQKWTTKAMVMAEAATVTVNVPDLAPEVGGGAVAAGGSWWTGQRIAGVALGGVGVVGVIVGSVFAAKAAGKNNDSLPHCLPSDDVKCDATGVALRNEAFDAARISNVTFIAGGILATSGLLVILTAPSAQTKKDAPSARVEPMIGAGFAGLTLQGAW